MMIPKSLNDLRGGTWSSDYVPFFKERSMTMTYLAKCPICNKKTALRIQDGRYLNEYPIRINCMNCRALIKGVYIMAGNSSFQGLHLDNAVVEMPLPDTNSNLSLEADYVAEISGELPCAAIKVNDGKWYEDTPFMASTEYIENPEIMIDRLKHFSDDLETWKKEKIVAFQLLNEGSFEYLPKALKKSGVHSYKTANLLQSLHCLQEVVLKETRFLFINSDPYEEIQEMMIELGSINTDQITGMVSELGGGNELIAAYQKMLDVVVEFMRLYPLLLPAEIHMHSKSVDANNRLSTCTFSDIKQFYQDTYETVMSNIHVVVCLENILERKDYSMFSDTIKKEMSQRRYNSFSSDLQKFMAIDNGQKLQVLCERGVLQRHLLLPNDGNLRNGIGHNNYQYNAISQAIVVFDSKKRNKIKRELDLMEMASECCDMVLSCVLISELILFLLRRISEDQKCVSHLAFYSNLTRNEKCPCGSGKEYEQCCMPVITKKYTKRSLAISKPKLYFY